MYYPDQAKKAGMMIVFMLACILLMACLFVEGVGIGFSTPLVAYFVVLFLSLVFTAVILAPSKPGSLTSLFFISCFVFLFGRFIGHVFFGLDDIFSIGFFAHYTLNEHEASRLSLILSMFMLSILIGVYLRAFFFCNWTIRPFVNLHVALPEGFSLRRVVFFLFALSSSALYSYSALDSFITSRVFGYLALYSSQGELYSGSSFVRPYFFVMLGLSFAFGVKLEKKILLITLAFSSILFLLAGQRSVFVSTMFLFIWIYAFYRGLSWTKAVLFLLATFFSLMLLGTFSQRASIAGQEGVYGFIANFFFIQGISMMVFDVSVRVSDYPLLAFFQSFIPGSSRIYSFFYEVRSYDIHYADYLAYTLDSEAFYRGQGLGWTLPGSFYIWSGGMLGIFSLFSVAFGYCLRLVDEISGKSRFWTGAVVCLLPTMILLPRSQFSFLIPLFIYYFIFYLIFTVAFHRDVGSRMIGRAFNK